MPAALEGKTDGVSALEEAIQKRSPEQVEELWLELAQDSLEHLDSLLDCSDQIAKIGNPAQASLLLLILVSDLMSAEAFEEAYRALARAATHTPLDRDVRKQLVRCIESLHAGNVMLPKALEQSDLSGSADLRKALKIVETFIGLEDEVYVYHEAGWGIGKITEVSPEDDEVFIDFAAKKNHRMAFSAMGTMVKVLAADHFRVLLEFDPDRLKELAASGSPELIKKVLRDEAREMNLRQVKAMLVGPILSASGWTKYWASAKAKIRRDTSVNLGPGTNPTLELQPEVMTYEESMLVKFRAEKAMAQKVRVLRDYLSHKSGADAPKFLVPAMADMLPKLVSAETAPEDRFLIVMAYDQARPDLPDEGQITVPSPAEFLSEVPDIPGLLENVPVDDYQRQALDLLSTCHPEDWQEVFGRILLSRCNGLWEPAYRGLVTKGHAELIKQAYAEIFRERDEKPENFAWFCRAGVLGRIRPDVLDLTRVDFFEFLIVMLDKVASERGTALHGPESRQLATKLRQIILQEVGDRMLKIFEEAGPDRTRQILSLAEHNRGLNEHQNFSIEARAYTLFPALDLEKAKKPYEDETAIYTTEAGYQRREDDLRKLQEVDLREVAREIGRAKEFGDLSENAEYTAALEKQAQLAQRAEEIQSDLREAKYITPDIVLEDEVSIGSRITLRNTEGGFLETYTILGPWDVDSEERVISYRAPLARGLMGYKQGHTVAVDLPDGQAVYEVMAVVNALT